MSNNNSNKLSEEEEEKEDNATRLTPNTSTIGKEFPEDSVIPYIVLKFLLKIHAKLSVSRKKFSISS